MFEPVSMSQAELSVSTPGKLIRWHYLGYVAVAIGDGRCDRDGRL